MRTPPRSQTEFVNWRRSASNKLALNHGRGRLGSFRRQRSSGRATVRGMVRARATIPRVVRRERRPRRPGERAYEVRTCVPLAGRVYVGLLEPRQTEKVQSHAHKLQTRIMETFQAVPGLRMWQADREQVGLVRRYEPYALGRGEDEKG